MEDIFLYAINLLEDLSKPILQTKLITYYKIIDENNNTLYVGNTTVTLNERLEYHKTNPVNHKMKQYLSNNSCEIIELEKKHCTTFLQINLFEDYLINKNNTIVNGLNERYNSKLSNIIVSSYENNEKYKKIQDYITNYIANKLRILKFIYNFENTQPLMRLDDIPLHDYNWMTIRGMNMYDPQVLFDNMCDLTTFNFNHENSYDDIIGIYLFYSNNDLCIVSKKGGIKKAIVDILNGIKDSKLLSFITNNSNYQIIPILYIRSEKYTDHITQLIYDVKKILYKKKVADKYVINEYHFFSELLNIIEIKRLFNKYFSRKLISMKIEKTLEKYDNLLRIEKQKLDKTVLKYKKLIAAYKKNKCDNYSKIINKNKNIIRNFNNYNIDQLTEYNCLINEVNGENKDVKKVVKTNNKEVRFYKKKGRPQKYESEKEKKEARLKARREWYNRQKDRVKIYNKEYYENKLNKYNI